VSTDSIFQTLQARSPGGVLALPASTFGAGALEDVIAEYCEGRLLRATGVSLQQSAAGVHLTGTGTSAPFAGMGLDATFVPDPASQTGALMTLRATPPSGWTLATSWPLLASSFFQRLTFSPVSLTLGTGGAGEPPKGLTFDGGLGFGGASAWAALGWLVGGLATIELHGPVAVTGAVPVFSLTAPIQSPVSVGGLGDLHSTFTLACTALATGKAQASGGGPVLYPYVPLLDMSLSARIPLGAGVPVTIDLASPTGLVTVNADITALTGDFLELLGSYLGIQDLGGFLPKTSSFDPSGSVELVDLGFTISPARKAITSTSIALSTPPTLKWPLARGIDIAKLGFELVVPFNAPPSTPAVFATVFGCVSLPGGELDISGSYGGGFQLAAGLAEGSHVKVTDLLDSFLPTQLDAELYLYELEMMAATNGSWSLVAGLDGGWGFSVGILTVALVEAWIQLENSGGVSGTISATARLGSGSDALVFSGAWVLPKTFALTGSFPDIDLSALAAKLTGTTPASGLPEISLSGATASIVLRGGGADTYYDFSMAASATLAGHGDLGRAGFEVRKDERGFGFLIGFDLPAGWSPGAIWQPLASLFGALTFGSSGLVVSTLSSTVPSLENLKMPSLPATLGPGVTFFSSLELTGAGIGYLAELLPAATKLDLLAVIDSATPASSIVSAALRVPAGRGAVQFTGLAVTFQPAATRFTVTAGAVFHLKQGTATDTVTLTGTGSVQIEPNPGFTLQVTLKNWNEPFGIERLTVRDFGIDLGVVDDVVVVGALGAITINQGSDSFEITIGAEFADFEVPDAIVFELGSVSGKTLMLASVIDELTSLDTSKVPVLGGIGFADLKLWLIGNPAGWQIGGYTFPPGVAVHADVTLYEWELTLDIEVHATNGIKASGAVNHPIDLYGVLVISSFDGTSGPAAGIDTSQIAAAPGGSRSPVSTRSVAPLAATNPPRYLWLDGALKFLQFENYKIKAEVTKTSFDFELDFEFLAALTVTLACSLSGGESFTGSADFSFDVELTLGPLSWEGIELIPVVHISKATGAASVGVAVNRTVVFDLAFGLAFDWSSTHVNVNPHFTAADLKNDLTQLWSTVAAWMRDHVEIVFSELLGSAEKWVEAVTSGALELSLDADQVARVLEGYFNTGVAEAAEYLRQFEFAFKDMVEALVHWFDVSVAEAAKLLGEVEKQCAITSADALLPPGTRSSG
jgi:hypothetical protein